MRVRALDNFYYERDRKRGEIFEMKDAVHVQMLTMNSKIEAVVDTETPQKRNRYRRSDMRADE